MYTCIYMYIYIYTWYIVVLVPDANVSISREDVLSKWARPRLCSSIFDLSLGKSRNLHIIYIGYTSY